MKMKIEINVLRSIIPEKRKEKKEKKETKRIHL